MNNDDATGSFWSSAQASYRSIFHAVPGAVVLASLDGIVLDMNDDFVALVKSPRDALVGRSVIDLGLYPDQRVFSQGVDHLLAVGGTNAQESEIVDADGVSHWIQSYSRCIDIEGKTCFLIVSHDITARHQVEESLKYSESRYQALLARAERAALESNLLNQVRNLVARQVDMQDVIRTVVEGVSNVFGYTLVSLYLVEGNFSVLQHQVGYRNVLSRIPVTIGVLGRVVRTGKPVLLQDTSGDPEFLGAFDGITSEICVPLRDGDRVVGALNVEATDSRRLTDRDLDFLLALSEHVSIALHRASLFKTERQQRLLAETLRFSAADLATADDTEDMLQAVFHHLRSLMPYFDAGAAFLIDSSANRPEYVVMTATGDASQPANQHTVTPPLSLPWQRTALAGDTALMPELNAAQIAALPTELQWIRSVVAAPLRAKEHVIGFVELTSGTAHQFNHIHAYWLQAFADQAGPALQNAQYTAALKRQTQLLEERIEERSEQYRHTKEQVEAILNSSGDSILLLDRDGVIQQANPAFESLLGADPGEVLGIALAHFATPEYRGNVVFLLNEALSQRRPVRDEIELVPLVGETFIVEVTMNPVTSYLPSDPYTDIVCTLHDITARRHLETELRSSLQKERQLVELKSRFSAMISHEFRTPLATIQSSNELLQTFYDRLEPDRRADLFRSISEQVQHLSGLLEDIMAISRAETIGLDFHPEQVNLVELCQRIIDQFNLNAVECCPVVLTTTDPAMIARVDVHLIRRILINLITNALKYSTDQTPVEVALDQDDDFTIIRVTDRGIGIPPGDLERLFDAFHRAVNVGTIPGTGLGLTIVKRAVDAHDGTIEVSSQLQQGSTFTIRLPRRATQKRQGTGSLQPVP